VAAPAVGATNQPIRILDPRFESLPLVLSLAEVHHTAIAAAGGSVSIELDAVVAEQVLAGTATIEERADVLTYILETRRLPHSEVHVDLFAEHIDETLPVSGVEALGIAV
jgi:hypothetical protein